MGHSDQELVILTRKHVTDTLERYLSGDLTFSDIDDWASALESRDDVGLEVGGEDLLREMIHELANPFLTRALSPFVAREWVQRLTSA